MGDPHRNMCQRADAVPSYKSLPGSVGHRIMSSGSGTLCRGTMNPGFGRCDRKVACCEKCSATLVALKKQALSLAVHHHFSCKVSNQDALMGKELVSGVVDLKCNEAQSAHFQANTSLYGVKCFFCCCQNGIWHRQKSFK